VCSAIGLETGTAAQDYIGLYGGGAKLLNESLEYVQRTATQILSVIGGCSICAARLRAGFLNLTGVLRPRTSCSNATRIAERDERWEQTLRMTRAKSRFLHEATHKMVELTARIGLI